MRVWCCRAACTTSSAARRASVAASNPAARSLGWSLLPRAISRWLSLTSRHPTTEPARPRSVDDVTTAEAPLSMISCVARNHS
ncbi:MAG: hypothetical protein CMH36_10260 [Microbacterium sp.]|nr:hypothetical protein [Microbacterium sp.]